MYQHIFKMAQCAECGSEALFSCKHCGILLCKKDCKGALIQNSIIEKIEAVFFDFDQTLTKVHSTGPYGKIRKMTDRNQAVQAFRDLMVDADAFIEFVQRLVASNKTVAISTDNSKFMVDLAIALLFDPDSYPETREGERWTPRREPRTPFGDNVYGMGDSRLLRQNNQGLPEKYADNAKKVAVFRTMGEEPQGYSNVLFLDDSPRNRGAVSQIGCQAPVVDPSVGLTQAFLDSLVVTYNLYE